MGKAGLAAALEGMSCTCPSVTKTAPAMRSGGTSAKASASGAEQRGAAFLAAAARLGHRDDAYVEVFLLRQLRAQLLHRVVDGTRAIADRLALALVGDDDGDVGQTFAFFLDDRGIGQHQQRARHRQSAPPAAGRAQDDAGADERHAEDGQKQDRHQRQMRNEDDVERHGLLSQAFEDMGHVDEVGSCSFRSKCRSPD